MDTEERGALPSQRAEHDDKERKAQAELHEDIRAAMREDFGRTFGTECGKRVLAWLFDRCGWDKSTVALNPQTGIDKEMSLYLAQERNVYGDVRKHVPINILQEVEYGGIKPSGWIDNDDINKRRKRK